MTQEILTVLEQEICIRAPLSAVVEKHNGTEHDVPLWFRVKREKAEKVVSELRAVANAIEMKLAELAGPP